MSPDSLRAVLDSVLAGPAYRWVERPDPMARVRGWFEEAARWLAALREHNPLGFRLVMAALIVLLVAILVHAAWVLVRTVRPAPPGPETAPPAPARRDSAWYRREAERLAREGRYPEAMQADFLALILALDAAQIIRFHPAKTPREYAREPGIAPTLRQELGELVSALYRHLFARQPCGPAEYEAWRERVMPERHAAAH